MRKKKRSGFLKVLSFLLVFLIIVCGYLLVTNSSSTELLDSNDKSDFSKYEGETAQVIVENYANENNLSINDYPKSLIDLLDRNPDTIEFVLEYPFEKDKSHEIDLSEYKNSETVPLFMQWDKRWGYIEYGDNIAGLTACGPVCLSMCAFYLTNDNDMSPDKIISFSKDNGYCTNGSGSLWTLISEGGEKLGLDVTEIPLVESRIIKNLEAGNPIICIMGPGVFTKNGHYIVLSQYHDGKFTINDPNSYENSEKEWEYNEFSNQIKNLWVIR